MQKEYEREKARMERAPSEHEGTSGQQNLTNRRHIRNPAGGAAFKANEVDVLTRHLLISHSRLIPENRKEVRGKVRDFVVNLIKKGKCDELMRKIKDLSKEGRCYHRSNLVYCLAFCARYRGTMGGVQDAAQAQLFKKVRQAACNMVTEVCCTPTDLFQFVADFETIGKDLYGCSGWGRAFKRAIRNWYLEKEGEKLAYFVTKYQRRHNWSHKDLLKLSHPKVDNKKGSHAAVFRYITRGYKAIQEWMNRKPMEKDLSDTLGVLFAAHHASRTDQEEKIIDLVRNHGLVREQVPTKFLKNRQVWVELFKSTPLMALIRNLGNLTAMNLFVDEKGHNGSEYLDEVCATLKNRDHICKARIHPICILLALNVYCAGRRWKGSVSKEHSKVHWEPNERIKEALENAFYLSLKFCTKPITQRYLIAIDVSNSMFGKTERHIDYKPRSGCRGCPALLPAEVAAAMTMVFLNDCTKSPKIMAFSEDIAELDITTDMNLSDVLELIGMCPSGRTDCAQPMIYAKEYEIDVDVFIIFTDNETYSGDIHPCVALNDYRAFMRTKGISDEAKLVVCAMTATKYTIADHHDTGVLEIAGFDPNVAQVISEFAALQL